MLINSSAQDTCKCYTATSTVQPGQSCAFDTSSCIQLMCIAERITTIPGPNSACPTTPAVTSTRPCATACPTGCATTTYTQTGTSTCDCFKATVTRKDPLCPPYTGRCNKRGPSTKKIRTTIPGRHTFCPVTPTVTSFSACQSACLTVVTKVLTFIAARTTGV